MGVETCICGPVDTPQMTAGVQVNSFDYDLSVSFSHCGKWYVFSSSFQTSSWYRGFHSWVFLIVFSVLTYLEMHRVPCVLYACYKDVRYVDIETIKQFKKILGSTPIKDFVVVSKNNYKYLPRNRGTQLTLHSFQRCPKLHLFVEYYIHVLGLNMSWTAAGL